MARALYRSRQVLHALRPRIASADLSFARDTLSEAEYALFSAMESRDQRHVLEVASRLRAAGVTDRDLLVAALLHDCGKGRVPVWLRIAYVLAPAVVRRLGDRDAAGLRGSAYRLVNHVRLGAELAEKAGASATTVRLIGGNPEPQEAPLLARLMAADDAS